MHQLVPMCDSCTSYVDMLSVEDFGLLPCMSQPMSAQAAAKQSHAGRMVGACTLHACARLRVQAHAWCVVLCTLHHRKSVLSRHPEHIAGCISR